MSPSHFLRDPPWASLPRAMVERLAAGGKLFDTSAGAIVYSEADTEVFAVVVRGLFRVYMHTSDGRQATVRYARPGSVLGAAALVGGPAPVFVQGLADSSLYFNERSRRLLHRRLAGLRFMRELSRETGRCVSCGRDWRRWPVVVLTAFLAAPATADTQTRKAPTKKAVPAKKAPTGRPIATISNVMLEYRLGAVVLPGLGATPSTTSQSRGPGPGTGTASAATPNTAAPRRL